MSWFKKATTGYLDTQPFNIVHHNWEQREKELHAIRDQVRAQAIELASKNGHVLNSFTTLTNMAQCKVCGKEVHVMQTYSTAGARIRGRAIEEPCESGHHDSPYDPPKGCRSCEMLTGW